VAAVNVPRLRRARPHPSRARFRQRNGWQAAGVEQWISIAGIIGLDTVLASPTRRCLSDPQGLERARAGRILRSLFVCRTKSVASYPEARILVIPPPPIQEASATRRRRYAIELWRDGNSDFGKPASHFTGRHGFPVRRPQSRAASGEFFIPARSVPAIRGLNRTGSRPGPLSCHDRPRSFSTARRPYGVGSIYGKSVHTSFAAAPYQVVMPSRGSHGFRPDSRATSKNDGAQQPGCMMVRSARCEYQPRWAPSLIILDTLYPPRHHRPAGAGF